MKGKKKKRLSKGFKKVKHLKTLKALKKKPVKKKVRVRRGSKVLDATMVKTRNGHRITFNRPVQMHIRFPKAKKGA